MEGQQPTPPPRLVDLATLGFTFFAVGITVSVALVERGVPTEVVLTAAVVIYSATSELAFMAVDDAGGSTAAGILSGWLVATRFGLLAVTLRGRFAAGRAEQVAAALNALDPNVGLAIQQPDGPSARRVYWQTTSALVGGWLVGSVAGVVLGNVLGDTSRWGFDVVFPAALLAIIGPLLRRREGLSAAVLGALLCVALIPIAPGGVPILATAAAAAIVVATQARSSR